MMEKIIVQIYEIQTPSEADLMISLGADHVGSVLVSEKDWKLKPVKETIRLVKESGVKSSLIPLYNEREKVFKTLDYYRPDIIHFCETLFERNGTGGFAIGHEKLDYLISLQDELKEKFPNVKVMRAVPIAPHGQAHRIDSLMLAELFEPVSDYFLTDTFLVSESEPLFDDQPEEGFVGITGKTCDWETAKNLVEKSRIPVILAGGLSPENVRESVLKVRPAGVDSCTCTNALDGNGKPIRFQKDPEKVRRMIESVRKMEMEFRSDIAN